jgi:hypothetical protein
MKDKYLWIFNLFLTNIYARYIPRIVKLTVKCSELTLGL